MDKGKTIGIVAVLLVVIFIGTILALYNKKSANFNTDYEEKYTILKATLKDSGYYSNSSFKYNDEKDLLTIDSKYNVYIKSGYYLMNIRNEKDEEEYCHIVDAVEMHLGYSKGESLETCHMTLDGIIDIGGISVTKYDNYKVLTVNYKEKTILYSKDGAHKFDEAINVDEQNYTVEDYNYIFSSITTSYSDELKQYSICGNIYNDLVSDGNFTFELYNNKEAIDSSEYQYDNDKEEYKNFCVEFKNIELEPSYFMVHLNK